MGLLREVGESLRAGVGAARFASEADPAGAGLLVVAASAPVIADVLRRAAASRGVERLLGEGGSEDGWWRSAAPAVAAIGLRAAQEAMSWSLQWRVASAARDRMTSALIDVVAGMSLEDIQDPEVQDALQARLLDAMRAGHGMSAVLEMPAGVVLAGSALVRLWRQDRVLAALVAACSVPAAALTNRYELPQPADKMQRHAAMLRHTLTAPAAAPELTLFDARDFVRARYERLATETRDELQRRTASMVRDHAARGVARQLLRAPAAARVGWRRLRGDLAVSDAAVDALVMQQAVGGVQALAGRLAGLRSSREPVGRVLDFLRAHPLRPPEQAVAAPPLELLRLDDLTFTYRGAPRPALAEVNLQLAAGETIALVGENGSGKTTLAKVICGLYQPSAGSITWNGTPVSRYEQSSVRRRITAMFQTFQRYLHMTISDNIAIGDPHGSDDERVQAAAKKAGAHDFISALPEGYATVASRSYGGVDLSTGQWQRLAAARAFIRDASLVVLDEPTAALDPRAERALYNSTAALYQDRATLLISHRLSTVQAAQRIYVLVDGHIAEQGTHAELLGAGGKYAELYEIQAAPYR